MEFIVRSQHRVLRSYGTFDKDRPDYISSHKMDKKVERNIIQLDNFNDLKLRIQYYYYKMEWKKRPSGFRPRANYYTY